MSTSPAGPAGNWPDRVEATDWDVVRDGLENYGCGLTGPLLASGEAAAIAALFRTTPGSGPPWTWPGTVSARESTAISLSRFPRPSPR